MTAQPGNLLVMLSGSGRTLVNLVGAIDRGRLDAKVTLVGASRPCPGLERASELGRKARVLPGEIPVDEQDRLTATADAHGVVLAGYDGTGAGAFREALG